MLGDPADCLLSVNDLVTGYHKKQVLNGVTIKVSPAEIVAIIGHNGAGKSTVLKAIFGVLPIWQGQVVIDGNAIAKPQPRQLLASGIRFIPQGNCVFGELTVRENLECGSAGSFGGVESKNAVEQAVTTFPILKDRLRQRASLLSGGEKQMLALAMAGIDTARLFLMDEPSLGLAPALVTSTLERISRYSRERGTSALIVEQKVREVLNIADKVYVLRNGRVSYSGPAEDLQDDDRLREVYL